ncbi:nitroimidazol reductase NimA-like FMN-containing flavoprotein (pyridoxamine 5'-phosphate oxidase superfamily) [Streptomyces sp. 3330]|uniref:helix-turn-helix domain-containing protein n=1 Tax=Streptomyces sp. 3330 TaxID=2817755 RepID=UPI00285DCA00|nr:pyridoxamine 5'-phosphate oxidase family protein [Streptomyces sp. 3330]MDR6975928.1 nitroimidazol reductase NimA-like FMN-containing flavoprotein (pyridoxamine 5'-phosphate oxidase superfamily) [Streptomyces sp. 3330]
MTEQTRADSTEGAPSGDLGRRLAARRVQLGLTRKETADRAGMAPTYVAYLEQHSEASPGRGALLALAAVLETTVAALTGADADRPPGRGQAGHAPTFTELSRAECAELLSTHGVGRLAVSTARGPEIVPVNYSVVEDAIVFRTARGATPSLAAGCPVAFEVDRIDDVFSQGWSVLVRGDAHMVTDVREERRLAERALGAPWAGGRRDVWVRIEPQSVTGRRIVV